MHKIIFLLLPQSDNCKGSLFTVTCSNFHLSRDPNSSNLPVLVKQQCNDSYDKGKEGVSSQPET